MALGVPGTPWATYIPGSAIRKFFQKGNASLESGYKVTTMLTSALPAAATAGLGAKAWVSDATSATFGAAPTGGGSTIVPVWCDGVNWYIGGGN